MQNLESASKEMSELCSIWRPFCFLKNLNLFRHLDSLAEEMSDLCSILQFGGHFVFQKKNQNLFGLYIRTSMQNLDSVAPEISKLWAI